MVCDKLMVNGEEHQFRSKDSYQRFKLLTLQQDEALCYMTCGLDRTSLAKDQQLYITSPNKLFVPNQLIVFLSLTPAKPTMFIMSMPPKPQGRYSDASVGGGRFRIAFNYAATFQ
jgi:hypothetical protein